MDKSKAQDIKKLISKIEENNQELL